MTSEELDRLIEEELEAVLDEKSSKSAKRKRKKKRAKKKAKRDACYHKVKSRYKVWPSAYASGALVKCRKVGAKNWGNKSKKNEGLNEEEGPIEQIVRAIQGTTPGRETPFDQIISQTGMSKEEITQIGDTAETDDGVKIFAVSSTGMQMSKEYRQGLMAQAAFGGMFEDEESPLHKVAMALDSEGGAAGLDKLVKLTKLSKDQVEDVIKNNKDIVVHKAGDVVELSGLEEDMDMPERTITLRLAQMEDLDEKKKKKKKKPCKKAKGKRYVKRVNGRCRSFGQAGKAKGGGDRIRPGTKKGDAYCARSAKIKKCKNPPCANDLSRKKWKCRGSKSMRENEQE
tara:strand:+ start:495 stop:1520 length:1026 start_codon:yes stop_codon:yes gene_type:complete